MIARHSGVLEPGTVVRTEDYMHGYDPPGPTPEEAEARLRNKLGMGG